MLTSVLTWGHVPSLSCRGVAMVLRMMVLGKNEQHQAEASLLPPPSQHLVPDVSPRLLAPWLVVNTRTALRRSTCLLTLHSEQSTFHPGAGNISSEPVPFRTRSPASGGCSCPGAGGLLHRLRGQNKKRRAPSLLLSSRRRGSIFFLPSVPQRPGQGAINPFSRYNCPLRQ